MNLINNFSFRTKFLIIVIPLLIGILYFSIQQTSESFTRQEDMSELRPLAQLIPDLAIRGEVLQLGRAKTFIEWVIC